MNEYVLGIETSCDDTSAAVVNRNGEVRSSVIISQNKIHSDYGGIYPEFASRAHIQNIIPTINQALSDSSINLKDIKAIGVTRGPGLVGSLLVGLNTATAIGFGWKKQVIGVNHLRGHIRSAELEGNIITYPALVLLVSGGHTLLAYMKSKFDIILLGETRDDSVGEAYDKVGRMLDLGFPAGALVDKLAKSGNPLIEFPRPLVNEGLEFSFSGLKSAVARYIDSTDNLVIENIAASFVQSVMDTLITKCGRALNTHSYKSLVIVGGVAASPQLREMSRQLCDVHGIELFLPPIRWSTDNAAMIALATWDYLDKGIYQEPKAQLRLSLTEF
ncbi:MAG: tRNA (adenosine(37)-N6)-threonylcarbamoyltransferase complex transferase subunit TsaD [Ignavibacteria bacterium GWB2_35_6b]|nr:MAG: tRNA (adenosine(37)-N6)-threonylcarbamoyltransferase complex transferase subunit TsaD [Ignavibacteria bacterium GWB2_35_6b]